MKRRSASRLESLLAQDSTNILAKQSLLALRDALSVLEQSTGPLPIHHVRRVYTRRAKLNARKHVGGVRGFGRLIKSLNATPEKAIEIYAIRLANEVFSVFTNPSLTTLIGILISKSDFS